MTTISKSKRAEAIAPTLSSPALTGGTDTNPTAMMELTMETNSTRTTAEATIFDWAELAATDFAPWVHSADEWEPPSNSKWADLANPYLISVRLAWLTHFKSKSELVDMMDSLDEVRGRELMDQVIGSIDFFEGMAKLLRGAEARLLTAGAVIMLRDEEAI